MTDWLERARLSVIVASIKPLDGIKVAVVIGVLSTASALSFFSFGRSWKCTSSSRVLRMRSNASRAIKGLVSFPWSARMLAGSDVITRVALAMARSVAPWRTGSTEDREATAGSLSRVVVSCGAAGVEGKVDWIGEVETEREVLFSEVVTNAVVATGGTGFRDGVFRVVDTRVPKTLMAVLLR